jgi:hypothetical protein
MRSDRLREGYLPYYAMRYGRKLVLSTNLNMSDNIVIHQHTYRRMTGKPTEVHRRGFTRGMLYTIPVRFARGDVHFLVTMELPMWGVGATVTGGRRYDGAADVGRGRHSRGHDMLTWNDVDDGRVQRRAPDMVRPVSCPVSCRVL